MHIPNLAAWCSALVLAALPAAGLGHEVPATAQVRLLMKVEEPPGTRRAQLLVRAPLEAMRDIEFPQFGAGYLDIAAAEPQLRDAALVWLAPALRLDAAGAVAQPALTAVRASLPSNRAFGDYQAAAAHLDAPPLDNAQELPWRQAWLDAAFAYRLPSGPLTLTPRLAHLGRSTSASLTVLWPSGQETAFTFSSNIGQIRLAPTWHEAMADFAKRGIRQTWRSHDQLLLLLCLVLGWGRTSIPASAGQTSAIGKADGWRGLAALGAAFAAGHCLTLTSTALGFTPVSDWFGALNQALMAASILLAAMASFLSPGIGWRLGMAFGFASLHGVDLATHAAEHLQFAGAHPGLGLGAFNLGITLGLMALLAPAAWLWRWLRARPMAKVVLIVLPLLLAHAAWHSLTERGEAWLRHASPWADWGLAEFTSAMRWALIALLAATCYVLLRRLLKRWVEN